MKKLESKFKLWLDTADGEGALGDGKWQLLKTIEKKGSLTEACKTLHISYRKAWGDIKKVQDALGITIVEKHRGGKNGGSSGLTKEGKALVKAYTKFHSEIEKALERAFNKHIRKLQQ